MKDYYAILGITPKATPEEVRMAFRQMARIYHPDRNAAPDAEERFKDINDAYERLADPQKRKVYDELLNISADPDTAATPPTTTEPPPHETVTPPPPTTTPPPQARDAERGNAGRSGIYPPTWAILLIMLGAVIIVGVGVAALLNMRTQRPTGGAEEAKVVKLSTFTSPPTIPDNIPVVQESGAPIVTVLPNQLDVAGTIYPVVPVMPDQGRWPLPHEQRSIAVWLYGTVINYVVGLPYAPATESVLAGLTSADRIMLTLDNGSVLAFGTPQIQRIDSGDLSPMAQDKPGLTVMMLESEQATRLVVHARYLPEESIFSQDQRVDGLKVEILETRVVNEDNAAIYFIIEYQVTNESDAEMDATFFDMVLEDNAGQRYTLDLTATKLGQYGPLARSVAPKETATGSAGYAVLRTMPSPVTWIFRSDTTSANSTRFALTYEAPQPGPAIPDVQLSNVFDDGTRNVIVINGTIYNDGESPLVVTLDNIKFTYGGGAGTLQASTPLLPWNIGPDGFQDFEVQFSRPQGTDSVILEMLGFTYRIEGLEQN
ncbi:MAG: J domain-containing protein [Anaerolineae bacterium]|nr:J domain-containing protein [Anaerolineae bacterium]